MGSVPDSRPAAREAPARRGEANSIEQCVQTRGVFEHAPLNSPHKIDDALAKLYVAGGSPSEMAERELILLLCDRSLNRRGGAALHHRRRQELSPSRSAGGQARR
jgi:hypothetical protein